MSRLQFPPRVLISTVAVTQWMTTYITMTTSRNCWRSGACSTASNPRTSLALHVVALLRNKVKYLFQLAHNQLSPSPTPHLRSRPMQMVCLHQSNSQTTRHSPRPMKRLARFMPSKPTLPTASPDQSQDRFSLHETFPDRSQHPHLDTWT